jgi:succinylglutamate desuccinylase
MFHIVGERKLWLTTLGRTGRQYIFLIRSRLEFDPKKPNLLIAAGFHGEEPAGPWAILKWLKTVEDKDLKKANLSFLPCVNPVGFNRGTRYARVGEKTNKGFMYPEIKEKPSVEAKILLDNIDMLKVLAKDGFLSLHEDVTTHNFYVYSYGNCSDFAKAMRDEESKYFDVIEEGTKVNDSRSNDPEAVISNGIVHNYHDGSFEDMLTSKKIATRAIVTETPGYGVALEKRVEANMALITKFIDLTRKQYI